MTNKITHKLPKYIAVVSHHFSTSHDKLRSFVALSNTTEKFAIAEGVCKGFKDDETFSIHIAKKVCNQLGTETYKSIMRVFRDGDVNDVSKESFIYEWRVSIDDIDFE